MIRVYLPDAELHTTRSRLLDFLPECDCGWTGHRTKVMREARAEKKWHRDTVHQGRQ